MTVNVWIPCWGDTVFYKKEISRGLLNKINIKHKGQRVNTKALAQCQSSVNKKKVGLAILMISRAEFMANVA